MKKTITFIFLLCSISAFSQVSYRIDEIVGGGYYLVTITQPDPSDKDQRIKESPERFSSKTDLDNYVTALRKEADATRQKAGVIDVIAGKIEQAGNQFFTSVPKKKE